VDIAALLGNPDWATAFVSGGFAAVGSLITSWIAYSRYRRSFRLQDQTELILQRLFKLGYRTRSFETIRTFVPLADDKLREALLRAGAIRLRAPEHPDGEHWGLLKDHRETVFRKRTPRT
jgi:hypothetical protein